MIQNILSMPTTKTYSLKPIELTGDVKNSGLMEIPSDATLKDIVYGIGGGIIGGKEFKAIQLIGASCIYLNSDYLNLTLDIDSLRKIGFIGRLERIEVIDDSKCVVHMAMSSINSIIERLCGKCIPCREGTKRLLEILEKITSGLGIKEDIDILNDLVCAIADTSLCRLGKMSVNPVESTLNYFNNEYISHVVQKKCPANCCKMDGTIRINETVQVA